MGLLDRLRRRRKKEPALSPERREARQMISGLTLAVDGVKRSWSYTFDEELAPFLAASREVQAAVACELLADRKGWGRDAGWERQRPCHELLNRLFRRKLPLGENELTTLVTDFVRNRDHWVSETSFVGLLERCLPDGAGEPALREALAELVAQLGEDTQARRGAVRRIEALLGSRERQGLEAGEAWSDRLLATLEEMEEETGGAWRELLEHAGKATASRPTKKWLAEAENRREAIARAEPDGQEGLARRLGAWFGEVRKPRELEVVPGQYGHTYKPPIGDGNAVYLRGLVWTASQIDSPDLTAAIARLAEVCFRKIPDFGAVNRKVGNACIWALGHGPGLEGVAWLARLRSSVRYSSAKKLIAKATAEAAKRAGIAAEEIDELALPDFGLGDDGRRRQRIGDWTAVLELLPDDKTAITWHRAATETTRAKKQKSVPKAVKEVHAEEIRELKADARTIQKLLPGQRHRFESFYLEEREWPLATWRERYLEQPFAAHLARRLIWRFAGSGGRRSAIWLDGGMVDAEGRPFALGESDRVRLWHPLESTVDEVHAWRRFLTRHGVTQPFRQAHREVYLLTEAEAETRVYSNRFAAHILKQHQVATLMASRGWGYQLQGAWDSHNVPCRPLSRHDLVAQFWLEPIAMDDVSGSGIFLYVSSDQVCFTRPGEGDRLPLTEVPALIFSEVMREVDLFVSVSSIGADPTWSEERRGELTSYWTDFAFGELMASGEARRELFAELLPGLAVAERLEIDGRWLKVRGRLNRYRIHLGSGSIQRDPGGHVCIVPSPKGAKAGLPLPYEGDRQLAVILSKALLLAADDKITDPTILHQIR